MNNLMEKNKFNSDQIKKYHQNCQKFNPSVHIVQNPSSDDSPSSCKRNLSAHSKISHKTSFLISRRKPSVAFESPSERSDVEVFKNENPLSKTRRNFSTRKKQDFS